MTRKVLVVDDSATVRRQVRLALSSAGYDVLEAADGIDGLQMIKQDGQGIQVVLCDVNMPRMGGLEMLKLCQAANLLVTVLMLTTEGQPALIEKAKQFGAKGWIVKPFKTELLVAAVGKFAKA